MGKRLQVREKLALPLSAPVRSIAVWI